MESVPGQKKRGGGGTGIQIHYTLKHPPTTQENSHTHLFKHLGLDQLISFLNFKTLSMDLHSPSNSLYGSSLTFKRSLWIFTHFKHSLWIFITFKLSLWIFTHLQTLSMDLYNLQTLSLSLTFKLSLWIFTHLQTLSMDLYNL